LQFHIIFVSYILFDCCYQANEFRCQSLDKVSCILATFRCDQDQDCPDASDEMGCGRTNCSYMGVAPATNSGPYINCNYTTACILPEWICDGNNDCWDNSDEQNCCMYNTDWPVSFLFLGLQNVYTLVSYISRYRTPRTLGLVISKECTFS